MTRDAFFEDPMFVSMSEAQRREMSRALKKVDKFEKSTGQSLEDGFTREQYVALFNSMRIRRTYNTFHYKSLIMKYVQYLIANNVLDAEQSRILDSITIDDLIVVDYYKNINVLCEAVRKTINDSTADGLRDPEAFLPAAVSVFLAWYGLAKEEIADYLKADVHDDYIIIRGDKIVPPLNVLQFFTAMRDSNGYRQQAKGSIFHPYEDSEYLLRSRYNGHLEGKNVQALVARLNKMMDGEFSLELNVIRQSGIFFRAYQMECDSVKFDLSDPVFASKVFCEDFTGKSKKYKVAHMSRIQDFKLYKQLFY